MSGRDFPFYFCTSFVLSNSETGRIKNVTRDMQPKKVECGSIQFLEPLIPKIWKFESMKCQRIGSFKVLVRASSNFLR